MYPDLCIAYEIFKSKSMWNLKIRGNYLLCSQDLDIYMFCYVDSVHQQVCIETSIIGVSKPLGIEGYPHVKKLYPHIW